MQTTGLTRLALTACRPWAAGLLCSLVVTGAVLPSAWAQATPAQPQAAAQEPSAEPAAHEGAAPTTSVVAVPAQRATPLRPAGGPTWSQLSSAQRSALAPLEPEWTAIDAPRKQKWLDIARRFPQMSVAEQSRLQERMGDWARLSPQERGQARLSFQQARAVPLEERQARWEAYQSLPAEQRKALAGQAKSLAQTESKERASRAAAATASRQPATPASTAPMTPAIAALAALPPKPLAKSNIVPNPTFVAQPRQLNAGMLQARPGVSTTLISKPPRPPAHQQTGLPKIAATPEFVDRHTLLPLRGAQGAGVLSPLQAP